MNTSSFYRYLVGGLACFAALLCFTSVYAAAENKLSEPEEREALKENKRKAGGYSEVVNSPADREKRRDAEDEALS